MDGSATSEVTPDPSMLVAEGSVSISQGPPSSQHVARLLEDEEFEQNRLFGVVKEAIKVHSFSDEWESGGSNSTVPTEEDVQAFFAAENAPAALNSDQRHALHAVLENMKCWHQRCETLQSTNDESTQLMGLGISQVSPEPLPGGLEHKMKLMTLAVEDLLERPAAPPVVGQAPVHASNSENYWKAVGRLFQENPGQVLREWALQHFDKPYPTSDDKKLLGEITGKSPEQVSTWFTNYRDRTWKPMVWQLVQEIEQD